MNIHLLKGKIHRAVVTDASLDYAGSLGIDQGFMRQAGILPYEKILVGNITNGNRFETYAIPSKEGSGAICLNGAAARLGAVGDLVVIMAFCEIPAEQAAQWVPKIITLSENNTKVTVK
jgi:aspartate 1-decarboxylase